MVYIIVKNKKPFKESYLTRGGIVRAERDGIAKSTMMQEIVQMTSDLHPDARRDIVDEFIDREKGK
jgi:hypothetical protein